MTKLASRNIVAISRPANGGTKAEVSNLVFVERDCRVAPAGLLAMTVVI